MATKDTVYASELLGRGQNADTIDGKHADYFVYVKNVSDAVDVNSHDYVGSSAAVKLAYDKAVEALNKTTQNNNDVTDLLYKKVIYKTETEFAISPDFFCRLLVCSNAVKNIYMYTIAGSGIVNGWNCRVLNTSNSRIPIYAAPGSGNTINGEASIILDQSTYVDIYCDGLSWIALDSVGRITQ